MTAYANAPYWYIGSSKWSSVTAWASSTAKSAGALVRQNATPSEGNERVFVCIVAGTTKAGADPTWNLTFGSKTTDNTVTWIECTGQPAVNGDATNTPDWNSAKSKTVALGQIIKNIAATTYFVCTTAGTAGSGSEPTWNTTAGQTTGDGSVTWTSIGAVGNFGAFGAPHARLENAIASGWGVAGDTFYISNNHAQTSANGVVLPLLGTAAAPCNYICVTDTAAPPTTVNTTASITGTGTGGIDFTAISGSSNGYAYLYGIAFNAGTGAGGANITMRTHAPMFESCGFNLLSTTTSSLYLSNDTGVGNNRVQYKNCTFSFGTSTHVMRPEYGRTEIIGGSIAATGTVPTTVFDFPSDGSSGSLIVRDCDISAVTGNLVNMVGTSTYDIILANCKLGAGVAPLSGTIVGIGTGSLRMHNCDSGATNYRMYNSNYFGTSQQSTSTYNNAGATDGTTRISWKIDTTAKTSFGQPFVCEQIFQWNDTTGSSKTATVEIAGSATLTNADIWMEIEYLGNASYPLGSTADCRKASILTSAANVTSSSASWTGSPAVTQKLQVSFTPQMKGPIKARVYVAKASATVYVDPLITVA